MTEVVQDYVALLRGAESKISAPRLDYREFVALERQALFE